MGEVVALTKYYSWYIETGLSPGQAVRKMIEDAKEEQETLPCIQFYFTKSDFVEVKTEIYHFSPRDLDHTTKRVDETPPGLLGYIFSYPAYEGWSSRLEARPLRTYPGLEKLYEICKILKHKNAMEDALAEFNLRKL